MMSRADVSLQQLPMVISRLQSLRPLHEESLAFSQTIRHMQNQQNEILQLLTANYDILNKVTPN